MTTTILIWLVMQQFQHGQIILPRMNIYDMIKNAKECPQVSPGWYVCELKAKE